MRDRPLQRVPVLLLVAGVLAVMVSGCGVSGAAQPSPGTGTGDEASPASVPPGPTADPATSPTAAPTATRQGGRVMPAVSPMPGLPAPWGPASAEDAALVDRIAAIWNDRDGAALDEVYDPALVFASSWDGILEGGVEGVRSYLEITPNVYLRVSDVVTTTAAVPGLPPLADGSRWLSCVMRIHGTLVDTVYQVNSAGSVVMHLADEHATPDVRARDGFPAFAGLGL